jgi:GAF domain-containing protein
MGAATAQRDVEAGEAHLRAGALSESLVAFDGAYRRLAAPEARAAVLGRIAWVHQTDAAPARAWDALDRAFTELGRAAGEEKASVACELHCQRARLALEQGQPWRFAQSVAQVVRLSRSLPPSGALARAHAIRGFAAWAFGLRHLGEAYLMRGQSIATDVGDHRAAAYCLQVRCVAHYWVGEIDVANALMRRWFDDYAQLLEAGEMCLGAFNLRTIASMRGQPRNELAWTQAAMDLAVRHHNPPAAFRSVEVGAQAALASLGRDEEVAALVARTRGSTEPDFIKGFPGLLLWPVRIRTCTDRGDFGPAFDRLVRTFEAEGHVSTRAHPVLSEYYVHVAHGRVHQCLRGPAANLPGRLRDLRRALADLRAMARLPLVQAHVHAVEGYDHMFHGRPARARRALLRAKRLAEQETCPWVLYAAARAEAHLLRREGREEAARDKARVAALIAREHGTVHRVRHVVEEFDLDETLASVARASASASSESSSGTRPSRRRHLQALLRIARQAGRPESLQAQARHVIEEVRQAMQADAGFLVHEGASGGRVQVAVGARALEGAVPMDAHLLAAVRSTGEVLMEPGHDRSASPPGRGPLLACPLVLDHRVVGVLAVERTDAATPFDVDDRDMLVALGAQALSALELTRALGERAGLEERLHDAERAEAAGHFAGAVAVEVRQVLAHIEGELGALRARFGRTPDAATDLALLEDALDRVRDLTRRLMALSSEPPPSA